MYSGKRGMVLENALDMTNQTYKNKGLALIDKVPTPWKVHFDKRNNRATQAFPDKKSTVDFVGVSHGRAIAFEAKSTKIRTSFPLKNVEAHQVNYLLNYQDQGGIAFLIIYFEKLGESYFVKIDDFYEWWAAMEEGGRKSIPYNWFMLNCDRIKSSNGVILNYLEFCNTAYKTERGS